MIIEPIRIANRLKIVSNKLLWVLSNSSLTNRFLAIYITLQDEKDDIDLFLV